MTGVAELFGVFLATVAPLAGAASPLAVPLATTANYTHAIEQSIGGSPFSTDPRARVASSHDTADAEIQAAFNSCSFPDEQVISAIGPPPACAEEGEAKLEVFITANKECTQQGDVITYRIFVRNVGTATALEVTWHFEAPAGTTIVDGSENGTLSDIAPGGRDEFYITVRVTDDISFADAVVSLGYLDCEQKKKNYACQVSTWCSCMTNPLAECKARHCREVNGVEVCTGLEQCLANPSGACVAAARRECAGSRSASTSHRIDGDCSPPPNFESRPVEGEPVIICDEAEEDCTPFRPVLGPRFPQAQGPIICEFDDPRACTPFRPTLGPRFAEAIDDLIPGECSVLADDVVVTPAFHDAFLRFGAPAAPFMAPLYQNDQTFIRLLHSVELTGIQHVGTVRRDLKRLHDEQWAKIIAELQKAIGSQAAQAQLLANYDLIVAAWLEELEPVQDELSSLYDELQERRKNQFVTVLCGQAPEAFDPATCDVVEQAKEAVAAVCGLESDGGLAGALPGVRTAWNVGLNGRTPVYGETQSSARARLQFVLQQEIRNQIQEVVQDPARLPGLIATLHQRNASFQGEIVQFYREHITGDRQAATQVRLNAWGPAADGPKTEATACMWDQVKPPPVEQTWCESGAYPEFIIREAPEPVKAVKPGIFPPQLIQDGEDADINAGDVRGEVCGGEPGDPFWAPDCSCHCGEVVRCGNTFTLCEICNEITRHDIHVRHPQDTDAGDQFDVLSQLECLQEGFKHNDPFF